MTKYSVASSSLLATTASVSLGHISPLLRSSENESRRFQEWELRGIERPNGRKLWMVRFEHSQKQFLFARLAIELNWTGEDQMLGVLVMPYGLKTAEGVRLQMDDGPISKKIPFTKNDPKGGIVKLDLHGEALRLLRESRRLDIIAHSAAGKRQYRFSVPLDGFVAASDRLKEVNQHN